MSFMFARQNIYLFDFLSRRERQLFPDVAAAAAAAVAVAVAPRTARPKKLENYCRC